MPKRTTAIAAVVVLLFALTGCGEETATPADEPKPFAAPLTEAEGEGEDAATGAAEADESGFIANVRENLRPDTRIADVPDAELVEKGYEACDRIRADESTDHMTFFEGEERIAGYYRDSGAVITAARGFLCVDLIDYMPAN